MKYARAKILVTMRAEIDLWLWKKWMRIVKDEKELSDMIAECGLEAFRERFKNLEKIAKANPDRAAS